MIVTVFRSTLTVLFFHRQIPNQCGDRGGTGSGLGGCSVPHHLGSPAPYQDGSQVSIQFGSRIWGWKNPIQDPVRFFVSEIEIFYSWHKKMYHKLLFRYSFFRVFSKDFQTPWATSSPPGVQREHPAVQNIKYLHYLFILWSSDTKLNSDSEFHLWRF